jgi:hypothetical protein
LKEGRMEVRPEGRTHFKEGRKEGFYNDVKI